jgi:hypothetical protein
METTEELLRYRWMVEDAASAQDGRILSNGSAEHAKIVLECLFRTAREQVCLIADQTSDDVYSEPVVMSEVLSFLDRGGRIRAISENDDCNLSEGFWAKLTASPNAEVRTLNDQLTAGYKFHLLLADDISYRYERDRKAREALAAFCPIGKPNEFAISLKSFFDLLWSKAILRDNIAV